MLELSRDNIKIKTMESLTSEQLEYFRKKLVDKKAEIEMQLSAFAKKSGKIKDDYETVFEHIGDSEEENADEVANYEDNLAIEHSLEENLQEIDAALDRITNGTYGICTDCNKLMAIERLEAMPEATLCINCE
jgi:RNA polymerase-binding protein DksA